MTYHVGYLTGAPASGKTTLAHALLDAVRPLELFEYGARLTESLTSRHRNLLQEDVRARSASIVTTEDVRAVDLELQDFVDSNRRSSHIVIDSHAVTKEAFGFRLVPFSQAKLAALAPTLIIVLVADGTTTLSRIAANSGGRPMVTEWEAAFHTTLQASVASAYSSALGIPAYFLDGTQPLAKLVERVARLFETPVSED